MSFNRPISINELIKKLQEARKLIGGEKEVRFWLSEDPASNYVIDNTVFDEPAKYNISYDKSKFEIPVVNVGTIFSKKKS